MEFATPSIAVAVAASAVPLQMGSRRVLIDRVRGGVSGAEEGWRPARLGGGLKRAGDSGAVSVDECPATRTHIHDDD